MTIAPTDKARNLAKHCVCFAALLAATTSLGQGVGVQPIVMRALEPIEKAAWAGDQNEVMRLFPAARDVVRYGALERALLRKHLALAEWLLKQGVKPTPSPQGEIDALGSAARESNVEGIQLLCRYGADANVPGFLNSRPLHTALTLNPKRRIATVKALLACGADPRIPDQSLHSTPGKQELTPGNTPTLVTAVAMHDIELVRLLLDHGARVVEDEFCCAKKLMSQALDQPDVLALLVERGAGKETTGTDGASLLHSTVCRRNDQRDQQIATVRMLLANKPALDTLSSDGTPLMCASRSADPELAQLLITAGANVALATRQGYTAASKVIDTYQEPDRAGWGSKQEPQDVRRRALQTMRILLANGASPATDEALWRASLKDDEMGRLLKPAVSKWYADLVRECLASAPRGTTRRVTPSSAPSTPGQPYSRARVTAQDDLPQPGYLLSFSHDGKWLAYGADAKRDGKLQLVLVALSDTSSYFFDVADPVDLLWSGDSQALRLDTPPVSTIDLSRRPPARVEQPSFSAARRAGEQPCLDTSLWPMQQQSLAGLEPRPTNLSPDLAVRYQVMPERDAAHFALVALKGADKQRLLQHDLTAEFEKRRAEFRRDVENMITEDKLSGAEAKALRDKMLRFAPSFDEHSFVGEVWVSPTGRYAYYRISPPDRPTREKQAVQHLVLDIQAHPVRIWEIDEDMSNPMWHPNGRELWFLKALSGRKTIAAAAFPE